MCLVYQVKTSCFFSTHQMNRTIKEATVKRFHYDDRTQLCIHLADFIAAYNFGCRLKTLSGLTPYEFICKQWTDEPEFFKIDPIHQMPGLNRCTIYFFGYTFRSRKAVDKYKRVYVNISPAVSNDALKAMRQTIRKWVEFQKIC